MFKFNKNKLYINGTVVTLTKDYIDIADIDGILQTVQKVTSGYAMRRILAYSLVMAKCTDIKDFDNNSDVNLDTLYEKYYITGFMEKVLDRIKGMGVLDDGLEHLDMYDWTDTIKDTLDATLKDMNKIDADKKITDTMYLLNRLQEAKEKQEKLTK